MRKLIISLSIVSACLFWAFSERRTLMMHIAFATSSGEPPALLDAMEEGDGVTWIDDYFTVTQIAPDSFAIGEPRYPQQNYSYLLIGTQRALLFDAGPGLRDIRAVVETLTKKPITFLASHLHYDHIGNNVTFEDIAVVDLPYLRARAKDNQLTLTKMEHLGAAEGFKAPTWEVDHWWPVGHQIQLGHRTLTLLYTPGHTEDSISLWDEKQQLVFSGDYLYPGPLYGFLPNSSMLAYLTSAETLLSTLPEGTRFVGAHRSAPPGVPELQLQDLRDLAAALAALRDGDLQGSGGYPEEFSINENMTLLAEPRWLQDW